MKQEDILLVAVHEVGTRLRVFIVIKMLVTWNINDLHLWAHERIFVVVRRQANETVEPFFLASIFRLFKEYIVESLLFASEHNWRRFCA